MREEITQRDYQVFKGQYKKNNGDDSWVDTPVPIPNTEVKHSNADDSGDAKIGSCHFFNAKKRGCYLAFCL